MASISIPTPKDTTKKKWFSAVERDDIEMMKKILASKHMEADIVKKSANDTALYYAAKKGNVEMCVFLLQVMKSWNFEFKEFVSSAFYIAAQYNHQKVMNLLLEYEPDEHYGLEGVMGSGWFDESIRLASKNANLEIDVKKVEEMWKEVEDMLLDMEIYVGSSFMEFSRLLRESATHGRTHTFHFLMYLVRQKGWKGDIPRFSESWKSIEISETLLKQGKKVDGEAMCRITQYGSLEMLDWLVKHGGNLRARGEYNSTLVMIAQRREQDALAFTNYLLERQALIYATDGNGQTNLHWAVLHDNVECIPLLLKSGVNVKDQSNSTALHCCSTVECAKLLVEHGADLHVEDGHGCRPIHMCVRKRGRQVDLLEWFLGVDNETERESVLSVAMECGQFQCCCLLLRQDVDCSVEVVRKRIRELLDSRCPEYTTHLLAVFQPPDRMQRDKVGTLYYWSMRSIVIWGKEHKNLPSGIKKDILAVFGEEIAMQ